MEVDETDKDLARVTSSLIYKLDELRRVVEHPQERGAGWPTSLKPRLGPGCLENIDELLSRQPLGPWCPVGLQATGISSDGPGGNPDKLDGSAPEIFHRRLAAGVGFSGANKRITAGCNACWTW